MMNKSSITASSRRKPTINKIFEQILFITVRIEYKLEIAEIISEFPQNYIDMILESQLYFVIVDEDFTGLYCPSTNKQIITLRHNLIELTFRETVLHEISHYLLSFDKPRLEGLEAEKATDKFLENLGIDNKIKHTILKKTSYVIIEVPSDVKENINESDMQDISSSLIWNYGQRKKIN